MSNDGQAFERAENNFAANNRASSDRMEEAVEKMIQKNPSFLAKLPFDEDDSHADALNYLKNNPEFRNDVFLSTDAEVVFAYYHIHDPEYMKRFPGIRDDLMSQMANGADGRGLGVILSYEKADAERMDDPQGWTPCSANGSNPYVLYKSKGVYVLDEYDKSNSQLLCESVSSAFVKKEEKYVTQLAEFITNKAGRDIPEFFDGMKKRLEALNKAGKPSSEEEAAQVEAHKNFCLEAMVNVYQNDSTQKHRWEYMRGFKEVRFGAGRAENLEMLRRMHFSLEKAKTKYGENADVVKDLKSMTHKQVMPVISAAVKKVFTR